MPPVRQELPYSFPYRAVFVVSFVLCLCACASVVNAVFAWNYVLWGFYFGTGFWSGGIILFAGMFGIVASFVRNVCSVKTYMIISIFGCMVSLGMIALSAGGLDSDSGFYDGNNRGALMTHAIHAIYLGLGLLQLTLCVLSDGICIYYLFIEKSAELYRTEKPKKATSNIVRDSKNRESNGSEVPLMGRNSIKRKQSDTDDKLPDDKAGSNNNIGNEPQEEEPIRFNTLRSLDQEVLRHPDNLSSPFRNPYIRSSSFSTFGRASTGPDRVSLIVHPTDDDGSVADTTFSNYLDDRYAENAYAQIPLFGPPVPIDDDDTLPPYEPMEPNFLRRGRKRGLKRPKSEDLHLHSHPPRRANTTPSYNNRRQQKRMRISNRRSKLPPGKFDNQYEIKEETLLPLSSMDDPYIRQQSIKGLSRSADLLSVEDDANNRGVPNDYGMQTQGVAYKDFAHSSDMILVEDEQVQMRHKRSAQSQSLKVSENRPLDRKRRARSAEIKPNKDQSLFHRFSNIDFQGGINSFDGSNSSLQAGNRTLPTKFSLRRPVRQVAMPHLSLPVPVKPIVSVPSVRGQPPPKPPRTHSVTLEDLQDADGDNDINYVAEVDNLFSDIGEINEADDPFSNEPFRYVETIPPKSESRLPNVNDTGGVGHLKNNTPSASKLVSNTIFEETPKVVESKPVSLSVTDSKPMVVRTVELQPATLTLADSKTLRPTESQPDSLNTTEVKPSVLKTVESKPASMKTVESNPMILRTIEAKPATLTMPDSSSKTTKSPPVPWNAVQTNPASSTTIESKPMFVRTIESKPATVQMDTSTSVTPGTIEVKLPSSSAVDLKPLSVQTVESKPIAYVSSTQSLPHSQGVELNTGPVVNFKPQEKLDSGPVLKFVPPKQLPKPFEVSGSQSNQLSNEVKHANEPNLSGVMILPTSPTVKPPTTAKSNKDNEVSVETVREERMGQTQPLRLPEMAKSEDDSVFVSEETDSSISSAGRTRNSSTISCVTSESPVSPTSPTSPTSRMLKARRLLYSFTDKDINVFDPVSPGSQIEVGDTKNTTTITFPVQSPNKMSQPRESQTVVDNSSNNSAISNITVRSPPVSLVERFGFDSKRGSVNFPPTSKVRKVEHPAVTQSVKRDSAISNISVRSAPLTASERILQRKTDKTDVQDNLTSPEERPVILQPVMSPSNRFSYGARPKSKYQGSLGPNPPPKPLVKPVVTQPSATNTDNRRSFKLDKSPSVTSPAKANQSLRQSSNSSVQSSSRISSANHVSLPSPFSLTGPANTSASDATASPSSSSVPSSRTSKTNSVTLDCVSVNAPTTSVAHFREVPVNRVQATPAVSSRSSNSQGVRHLPQSQYSRQMSDESPMLVNVRDYPPPAAMPLPNANGAQNDETDPSQPYFSVVL